jgi:multidrug efflux pump subunit AcrA (membrane-fusion protein)
MNLAKVLQWSLSLLLIVGNGCRKSENQDPPTESVELFHKGKGVWLPEQIRSEFGLVVEEVSEKRFSKKIQKQAQVFRSSEATGEAVIFLSGAEAKELRRGQAVRLTFRDEPVFSGTLTRIENGMRAVSEQFEGVIEFPVREGVVAGMFFEAEFELPAGPAVVAVPKGAVLQTAQGTYVYARNGGHLIRTAVKTGFSQDGFIEIVDALYTGDAVVTKGIESVWLVELSALKGGKPCCAVPKKGSKG